MFKDKFSTKEFIDELHSSLDYITFYEDVIDFFLEERLKFVYSNKNLKKLINLITWKHKERRVVFIVDEWESSPPFTITLFKDKYSFDYTYDGFKKGDLLIKTDHVTMMSVGLRSISILRALVEDRVDFYPFFPFLDKLFIAVIFNLKII